MRCWNAGMRRRRPTCRFSARARFAVAQLALDAPGVVMARAISRHWSDAMTGGMPQVTSLSWRGLRAYFDNPWFAKALGGSGAER